MGVTVRTQLEHVRDTTGITPPLLDHHPMPEGFEYVWKWFLELARGGAITWEGLQAWSRLRKRDLKDWELDALLELEQVRLNDRYRKTPDKS